MVVPITNPKPYSINTLYSPSFKRESSPILVYVLAEHKRMLHLKRNIPEMLNPKPKP